MIPLIKTRPWGCLATAFAMAIPCTEEQFYKDLGHDGGMVINASAADTPWGHRGIHIQEAIYVARDVWGCAVTPVEMFPRIADPFNANRDHIVFYFNDRERNIRRFERLIRITRGVITGMGTQCPHAMAYERGQVINPDDGEQFPYSIENLQQRKFHPQCLWIVT